MAAQTRAEKVKLLSGAWLEHAKREGLVVAPGPRRNGRSQVSCGVSVDYLAQLAASIRANPLLPSSTQLIVDNVINAATAESRCPFLDVIPQEHVGYATAVVTHAWSGDFLELLNAVVDDFNMRWEAHRAYRNQRKTAAQIMAEEREAAAAAEEAKRLQDRVDAVVSAADARAAAQWASDAPSVRAVTRNNTYVASKRAGGPDGGATGPDGVPLLGPRNAGSRGQSGPDTHRSGRTTHRQGQDAHRGGGVGPDQRRGSGLPVDDAGKDHMGGVDPLVLRQKLAKQQSFAPALNVAAQAGDEDQEEGQLEEGGASALSWDAVGSAASAFATQPSVFPALPVQAGFKLGDVVDALSRKTAQEQLMAAPAARNLKQAANKAILARRSMGAETPNGRRATITQGLDHHLPPVAPPNMLRRIGTLARVVAHAGSHTHEDGLGMPPMAQQSIYVRAKASADLTRLLKPLDEEQELLDAYVKAQKAAVDKLAAAKASQEQDSLREEKRKLLGYYVWIDVFALEQFNKSTVQPQTVDLAAMSRLINVVGRTLVIVDDDWGVLRRLWCLYEIWCSIKFKATLVTLSTATALAVSQSPTGRRPALPRPLVRRL